MTHGTLTFGLLGPFEVLRDGESLALGGRRQRAILAMLACEPGHAVSVERLVDGVWGDPAPPGVVTSVQSYIFHLRQVLEPDRLARDAGQRAGHRAGRLPAGRRSAGRGRGPVRGRSWPSGTPPRSGGSRELRPPRTGRRWTCGAATSSRTSATTTSSHRSRPGSTSCALSALEARIRADLDLGHHTAVVAELRTLVARHPLQEGLHAELMLALYRTGRQSDALAAYRHLHEVLDTELGIEPSPPLQELHTRILQQDPTLAWTPLVAATVSAAPPAPPVLPPSPVLHAHRARVSALTVVAVAVAGLAGGATLPLAEAPVAAAAVPANAVSELDENGARAWPRSRSAPTRPPWSAGAGAIWVLSAGDSTVYRVNPRAHAVVADDRGRTRPARAGRHRRRPLGHQLRRPDRDPDQHRDQRTRCHIEVGTRPDAIAAGPAGLWVANSGDNTIQRIDTDTGDPGEAIDVDDGPDGLAVDEDSVWVAHGRSGTVLQIDAETGEPDVGIDPGRQRAARHRPRGRRRLGGDELSQSVTRIDVDTRRTAPGRRRRRPDRPRRPRRRRLGGGEVLRRSPADRPRLQRRRAVRPRCPRHGGRGRRRSPLGGLGSVRLHEPSRR